MNTRERIVFAQRLTDGCLAFLTQLCDLELYSYQLEIADRILFSLIMGDSEEITVLSARQSGKTEALACTAATAMVILPKLAEIYPDDPVLKKFRHGVMVGVFGPIELQSETIFSRIALRLDSEHAKELLADPEIDERVVPTGKLITLKRTHSFCQLQTAHPKAKIESKTYHLIIIDEAQDADSQTVRKCYAEGTPVWTADGRVISIEQIVQQHSSVLAWNGEALEEQLPAEWQGNGEQYVWRVTLSSGRSLEVTENHRWLVRNRIHRQQPFEATTAQLQSGWAVPVPLTARFFGEEGDAAWGYFVGAMLGDGCFSGAYPQWCGHVNGSTDFMRRYVEKWGVDAVVSNIQPSGLLELRFTKPGNGPNPLTMALRAEGLWGLKGTSKRFPGRGYSAAFWRGAIAGLIDTDGSVELIARRISIASISEDMLRQVQDALLRLGIQSCLFSKENNGGFGAVTQRLWLLTIKDVRSLRLLAEEIELKDETKSALFRQLIAARAQAKSRRTTGAWAWDRIVSIEPVGVKRTYCVTVRDPHLFVVNGVLGSNSIHPMAVATAGSICKTGTSTSHKGDFYEAILRNQRRNKTHGKKNHLEFNYKRAAKENEFYAQSIEREKARLGEDSDEFQMSYMLKWLLDRGMFITDAEIEELGDQTMEIVPYWTDSPIVVGIDVAEKHDSTVCTALFVDWDHPDEFGLYDHRILNWIEMHGERWEEQYRQIVEFCSHYHVMRIGVDSQGMGSPVADRLSVLMPNVEVVQCQMNPIDQTERWQHLMQLIQRKMLRWPAGRRTKQLLSYRRFVQQMAEVEKEYRGKYLLVGSPPNERNAHDDYIDSLALAAAMTKDFGQTIEVTQWSHNPLLERGIRRR